MQAAVMSFWAMALVGYGLFFQSFVFAWWGAFSSRPQWVLESNNLPTCWTTPKHISFFPSMTLSLCLSGGKGNRRRSCQDGSCLCLPSWQVMRAAEPLVLSVGVGNSGLGGGRQGKLWCFLILWFSPTTGSVALAIAWLQPLPLRKQE